ncbi:YARHG domain-containing protein [Treponema socranskii]|uniref:YARHG domain-containing protein n=1 Tax=Treponema socranskii TaxID=53419 RepID=UPI0028E9DEFD|nr:YARHG domain-containing protein [Treponema socranskii]
MSKRDKMSQKEVEIFLKEYDEYKNATLVFIRPFYVIADSRSYWLTIWDIGDSEVYTSDIICFSGEKFEKGVPLLTIDKEKPHIQILLDSNLLRQQIDKFMLNNKYIYCYDFNHDGIDECIIIMRNLGNHLFILSIDNFKLTFKVLLAVGSSFNDERKLEFEFILCNHRRGIKIYIEPYDYDFVEGVNYDGYWAFYYYDRVQQKYVRDETASSEELEQIHGSPDFFAEAGIDYTKLERPLIPADLEGFSKPALRIWRNAVYARHGRIFKSEDLQALFNEYAWYKADKNYTDAKLTDTDKANIKLISEFEKK